jgi:hypothetical protein
MQQDDLFFIRKGDKSGDFQLRRPVAIVIKPQPFRVGKAVAIPGHVTVGRLPGGGKDEVGKEIEDIGHYLE